MRAWTIALVVALGSISSSFAELNGLWTGGATYTPVGQAASQAVIRANLTEEESLVSFNLGGFTFPEFGLIRIVFEAGRQGKFLVIEGVPVGMVLGDRIFVSELPTVSGERLSGEIAIQPDRSLKLDLQLVSPDRPDAGATVTGTIRSNLR